MRKILSLALALCLIAQPVFPVFGVGVRRYPTDTRVDVVSTTTAAATYLKLDCSNDPLTNSLDGNNWDFNGHAGLGADGADTATIVLDIDETFAFVDSTRYGVFTELDLAPAGAMSASTHLLAWDAQARWVSDQDGSTHASVQAIKGEAVTWDCAGDINQLISVYGKTNNLAQVDVTEAIGGLFFVSNDDGSYGEVGDITTAYDILARSYTDKGTGVIGTRHGVYIEDTTGGGLLTDQYGIYIEDMASGSASGTTYAIYSLGGNVELTDGNVVTSGYVDANEFNLADGEFIEWGTDETITFDGTDFQITDDLDFGTNILTDTMVGYIDQDVTSASTPTFTATNITGVPAASILAGTFGTGAYVFDNTVTGVTELETNILYNSGADLSIQPAAGGDAVLFGTTDVGAAVDGKSVYFHRKEGEGDSYIRFYTSQYGTQTIQGSAWADSLAFRIESVTGPLALRGLNDLRLQHNAACDINCFAGTDVDNAADGKSQYWHRKAAEGDTYLRIYGEDNKDMRIDCTSGGNLQVNTGAGKLKLQVSTTDMFNIYTLDAYDQVSFGLEDATGNMMVITNDGHTWRDFGKAAVHTNPTVYGTSDTDWVTATDEWWSLTHNVTDAELLTGSGGVIITAPAAAPTLTANGQYSIYLDEGGGNLKVTVKYSDGTAKTCTIAFD